MCVTSFDWLEAPTTSDIVSLSPANTQLTENRSNTEIINANITRVSTFFVFSPPLCLITIAIINLL